MLDKLKKTIEVAEKKHRLWESEWEETARYMLPKSGGFYDAANTINVPKDTSQIYDPTARVSIRRSSSALYAYSANPHTEWYSLAIPPKGGNDISYDDLVKNSEVKSFIEELSRVNRNYLNAALAPILRYAFDEMIAFSSTGVLLKESDGPEVMSAHNMELKNLYPLSDGDNKVNFIARRLQLTPQEASNEFGFDNLSDPVKESLRSTQGLDKEHTYYHVIYKRDQYMIDPDTPGKKNMPWASVYLDKSHSHIIKEDGYEEQPFGMGCIAPLGNNIFGNAPGTDALPGVRSLNKLASQQLEIGDTALAPAFNVPRGVYTKQLNLNPYALNYYHPDRAAGGQLANAINTYAGYTVGKDVINDQRMIVKEALYDLIVDNPTGDSTYEVQQGFINQLILMSPWAYPLNKNFFKPLAQRAFSILSRKKLLPEPPQILVDYLNGAPLQINFDNPLTRASQFHQLQAIDRTLQFAGSLAPVGGMFMVNVFKAIELYRKFTGAPPEILYSISEAEKRKKDTEKAQAKALEAQEKQGQINALETLSKSYKNAAGAERT